MNRLHFLRTRLLTRDAFTLVELMIVISIIGILSFLALVVLRDAQETARHARTRRIVAQCLTVLEKKLEAYETRTLPFRTDQVLSGGATAPNIAHKQHLRRRTIMEWIHTEMPHEWVFLDSTQVPSNYSRNPVLAPQLTDAWYWDPMWASNFSDYFTTRPTSARKALERTYLAYSPAPNLDDDAELLYQILYNTWENGTRASEFLKTSETTDQDGDGLLEIVDAWGVTLEFKIWVDLNQDGLYDPDDPNDPSDTHENMNLTSSPDSTTGDPTPPELKDIHILVTYSRAGEY